MKKAELKEIIRVVIDMAVAKPSPSYEELKSLNKLKVWLREQDEIASMGSRGKVLNARAGGANG